LAGANKIKTVFMDVRYEDDKPDVSLDIHLENGHILIIFLNKDDTNARFINFAENNHRGQPLTDGERIYWPDGPSLEFDELVDSLKYSGTRPPARKTTVTTIAAAAALVFIIFAYSTFFAPNAAGVALRDDPVPLASPAVAYTAEFPENGGANMGAGTTELDISLSNPANGGNLLAFEIVVNGEMLYESAPVDPGWQTGTVELLKPLGKGEYTAVLNVYSYLTGNLAVAGCVSEAFTITAN